jgi:phosphoribosylanthranilate isomerase
MFRVKICGVTRPEDVMPIAQAGADAIGINFYAGSSRFVDDARAREIVAAAPKNLITVGVFVNAEAAEIRSKLERIGFGWVQLHGDEPLQMVAELAGLPVIRTIRWGRPDANARATFEGFTRLPQAVLVDAYSPAEYGGTGQTIDWSLIPPVRRLAEGLPLILAGGLTPTNVAQAIRTALPDAVDTASGVESSPGVKDLQKVRSFVAAAREALDSTAKPQAGG